MAASKKSVDEIWKELNMKTIQPRSRTTGIPGFGIPGVQTHTRVLSKGADSGSQQLKHVAGDVSVSRDLTKPSVAYDPAAAGISQEQLQQYVATLQRTLNCLTDPDRNTRRVAVTSLHSKLFRGDAATPKASPEMLQALLAGPLLHPLTILFSDPLEKCRLTAVQLLLEAVPQLSDPGVLLLGLLPQLVVRMGKVPVEEAAEEVRLAALQLLKALISRSAASVLPPAAEDFCLLLARGFEDSYPDAKKEAAATLAVLAERLPAGGLEIQAERLLQALLPNLSHQHSKVRLAVLSGLRSLVLSGLPAGLMDRTLAPVLKPLAFDRAVAVREVYYAALASWLGCQQQQQQQQGKEEQEVDGKIKAEPPAAAAAGAGARCSTYAPVLLPLLLLGVSDDQQSIAAAALAAVEEAGLLWQQQQQQQQEQVASEACEDPVPMDTDGGEDPAAAASPAAAAAATAAAAVAAAQLPPPFTGGLPSEGCRQLVAVLLPQILPEIVAGLKEWTSSLRLAAARTLHTSLVLAGAAATPFLQQLLTSLMASMSEEDPEIVTILAACCRVLGSFVSCNAWLPFVVDALTDSKAGSASKANALVVTSCLVHAAAAAQQQPDEALLQMLVAALAAEDIRGCDHLGVQNQLLAVVANLLVWMSPAAAAAAGQQLYLTLLQLHGVFTPAVQQQGGAAAKPSSSVLHVLQLLAQKLQVTGAGGLAAAYAQQLLPLITSDSGGWTGGSSNLQAFRSLLQTSDADCLAGLLPQVVEVLHPILSDHDRDAALKLSLLKLLDELMEGPATAAAFSGSNAGLVLQSLLMPPLVWRAGKAAAAVRFQAITAVCTLISSKFMPLEALLAAATPQVGLLPLLAQSLDEDWYSDVRHTACYVMQLLLEQVGSQLDDGARRAVYPELLKRLDDSSNKVRIAVCGALTAFVESAGSSYCSTNSGYLAAAVVLHMDDGDQQVAEAACKVMEALAATKPAVAVAEVKKVQDRFRAQHFCERVLLKAGAVLLTDSEVV